MKTIILTASAFLLTSSTCIAQGTINFANFVKYFSNSPVVDAPFYNQNRVLLAGTDYVAQLYAGTSAGALTPVGDAVPFYKMGYFFGGTRSILFVPEGWAVWVQIRAWETAGGPTFEKAALAGRWAGVSHVLFVPVTGSPHAGGVPSLPADLIGLQYPGLPVIVAQPRRQRIETGGAATLSVIAASGVAQSYQWYRGLSGQTNAPVAGATNATWSVTNLASNASFWAKVSNFEGSTNSQAAAVEVAWLDGQMLAGQPALTVHGALGASYGIDTTTNVVTTNWTRLLEFTLRQSPLTFIAPDDTQAQARFYRLIQLDSRRGASTETGTNQGHRSTFATPGADQSRQQPQLPGLRGPFLPWNKRLRPRRPSPSGGNPEPGSSPELERDGQGNHDNTRTDQWNPSVAVNPQGTLLFIGYYSRQDRPGDNDLIRAYGVKADLSNGVAGATFDMFPISPTAFLPLFPGSLSTTPSDFDHAWMYDHVWVQQDVCVDINALIVACPEEMFNAPVIKSYKDVQNFMADDYTWAAADESYFYFAWCDRSLSWNSGGHSRADANVRFATIYP